MKSANIPTAHQLQLVTAMPVNGSALIINYQPFFIIQQNDNFACEKQPFFITGENAGYSC
jgi:hypothetical protein